MPRAIAWCTQCGKLRWLIEKEVNLVEGRPDEDQLEEAFQTEITEHGRDHMFVRVGWRITTS